MDWLAVLGLLAVGLLAGAVSALFGVGGGFVMVPMLHYVGGVEWHLATALSLVAIAVQSPSGVWQHARRGAVDWRLAVPMSIGGIAGVACGVLLEPHIGVPWLKLLFAVLMLLAAWRMAVQAKAIEGAAPGRLGLPSLLALGLLSGTIGKLLGIGGGLLTVPVLALAGIPVHVAVGSSLAPVFTNAALASGEALASGLAWQPAVPLALGALVGVPAGAKAAHALDEQGLRRVFAIGLVVGALYVGFTSGVI